MVQRPNPCEYFSVIRMVGLRIWLCNGQKLLNAGESSFVVIHIAHDGPILDPGI